MVRASRRFSCVASWREALASKLGGRTVHPLGQAQVSGKVANVSLDRFAVAPAVSSRDPGRSAGGSEKPEQHADGGGFTSPIGSRNPNSAPSATRRHALDAAPAAISAGEVVELDRERRRYIRDECGERSSATVEPHRPTLRTLTSPTPMLGDSASSLSGVVFTHHRLVCCCFHRETGSALSRLRRRDRRKLDARTPHPTNANC